jgi:transposase
VTVVLDRCVGDLGRVRRLGEPRFTAAVRRELPRWGATRPCLRIVRAVFAALADPAGMTAHRPGAFERVQLAMSDWQHTQERLVDVEARMVAVLDGLAEYGESGLKVATDPRHQQAA